MKSTASTFGTPYGSIITSTGALATDRLRMRPANASKAASTCMIIAPISTIRWRAVSSRRIALCRKWAIPGGGNEKGHSAGREEGTRAEPFFGRERGSFEG